MSEMIWRRNCPSPVAAANAHLRKTADRVMAKERDDAAAIRTANSRQHRLSSPGHGDDRRQPMLPRPSTEWYPPGLDPWLTLMQVRFTRPGRGLNRGSDIR